MKNLIKKTIKKNIILLLILWIYSTISGLLWIKLFSWNNNLTLGIYSFAILVQELTFPAIKSMLLSPIFNNLIAELKKYAINQIKSKEELGDINANFIKINSIRNGIEQIFISYKNILSLAAIIYIFFKQTNSLILFANFILLIIFALFFYKAQKFLFNKRNQAWTFTAKNLKIIQNSILDIDNIKQNLISTQNVEESLDHEAQAWISYYFASNLLLIGNALILSTAILINPYNIAICYIYIKKTNTLAKNIKVLIQYYFDFQFLKLPFLQTNDQIRQHSENLNVHNVKIYNSGPFTFQMTSKIAEIRGINGAGKTLLAKAIANLVPFEGTIESPKCLYIGLESQSIYTPLSKGEKILQQINLALTKDYELFIFDETLDILSEDNLKLVLKQLQNKTILAITHKFPTLLIDAEQFIITKNHISKIN